jgi:ADP-ribosylglycohydrolase
MSPISLNRFEGCLLGLALGDALGAPHEGGPVERLLWALIGRTAQGEMRWTDDTQMSLDAADSLLACAGMAPDDMAHRFARSYRWSRGYGPGAARLLKRIARGQDWESASVSVYPSGSYGNGGAMRAPPSIWRPASWRSRSRPC